MMHFFSSFVAGMFLGLQERVDACKAPAEQLVIHGPGLTTAIAVFQGQSKQLTHEAAGEQTSVKAIRERARLLWHRKIV